MTQDEQRMLQDLADKIANTPAPPRDPEAEDFIRKNIGKRPDALYLMTQTVLIQNLALQHAQQELQESRQGGGALPAAGGSFLGPAGNQSRSAGYGSQYSAPPPPQYAQTPQYAPASPAPAAPGGAPSFLKGAAQTAAGVAAGAFAFEGIRSLFSHPGYGGGGLFGGGGIGGYAPQVDETVVNNYYDTPQGNDNFGQGDNVDVNNYDDSGNNFDAGNVDDSGGFDNGGGFDGGGGGDDNNFS